MAGKLKLLVGFGAGYVLGARAGRERYDQIAGKAQELWRDPRVQEKAGQAQQVVKEKADRRSRSSRRRSATRPTALDPARRPAVRRQQVAPEPAAASRTSTGTSS